MDEHILNLDRPRKLHYGFKAMRLIREKFKGKKELTDVMDINVDEILYFAYVGLVKDDKTLTPEKVEDLIDDSIPGKYTVMKIVGIVSKAIAQQIGTGPVKKKAVKKIPSRRTGK